MLSRRVVLLSLVMLAACRSFSGAKTPPSSDVEGLAGKGLLDDAFPVPLKPLSALDKLYKTLQLSVNLKGPARSSETLLRFSLYEGIISNEGIPRSQIRETLDRLVSEGSSACDNHSCERMLGISETQIDKFLDDALEDIRKSPRFSQPDMLPRRALLMRSLEKVPAWLNPEDFGPALTPRKSYDLEAELTRYKDCRDCRISSERAEIKQMILEAREGDHFVWALRPDGRLVVGRGPDEKMSHGVLASIDLVDDRKTGRQTLNVLASGEGYMDPKQGRLYLNNKSGHYRPEFHRVNNPSMKRIFSMVTAKPIKDISFLDQTKPR